eukprot:gene24001-biopygen10407
MISLGVRRVADIPNKARVGRRKTSGQSPTQCGGRGVGAPPEQLPKRARQRQGSRPPRRLLTPRRRGWAWRARRPAAAAAAGMADAAAAAGRDRGAGSRFRSLGQQFRHVRTSGPEVRLARDLAPAARPTGADRAYWRRTGPTGCTSGVCVFEEGGGATRPPGTPPHGAAGANKNINTHELGPIRPIIIKTTCLNHEGGAVAYVPGPSILRHKRNFPGAAAAAPAAASAAGSEAASAAPQAEMPPCGTRRHPGGGGRQARVLQCLSQSPLPYPAPGERALTLLPDAISGWMAARSSSNMKYRMAYAHPAGDTLRCPPRSGAAPRAALRRSAEGRLRAGIGAGVGRGVAGVGRGAAAVGRGVAGVGRGVAGVGRGVAGG